MKTHVKFAAIAPLAALMLHAGLAHADPRTADPWEEEAPATLSFSTDVSDPKAPQGHAQASFIDSNTQKTVSSNVAAGFDVPGYDADGDVATPVRLAAKNKDTDKAVVAGTK